MFTTTQSGYKPLLAPAVKITTKYACFTNLKNIRKNLSEGLKF
jgi:hypothetical protein